MKHRRTIIQICVMVMLCSSIAFADVELGFRYSTVIATISSYNGQDADHDAVDYYGGDVGVIDMEADAILASHGSSQLVSDLVIEPGNLVFTGTAAADIGRASAGAPESVYAAYQAEIMFRTTEAGSFRFELSGVESAGVQLAVLRRRDGSQDIVEIEGLEDMSIDGMLEAGVDYEFSILGILMESGNEEPFELGNGVSFEFEVVTGSVATELASLSQIRSLFR